MMLFMRKFLILLFILILAPRLFARESMRLDSGWRFNPGDADGAQNLKFGEHSDKFWQTVSVPHCWGWEEAEQGREYYRGPGWYRRDLDIGNPGTGRRYFLRFEAAGFGGRGLSERQTGCWANIAARSARLV